MTPDVPSPWMTARESAIYARVGVKLLYAACDRGDLRAARVGSGRKLILKREWLDEWLAQSVKPVEITKDRRWA